MYYLMLVIGHLAILYGLMTFLPGVAINSLSTVLWGALTLTVLGVLLRPLILLVLLPLNMLTLGLFSLLTNLWMVQLADKLVPGLNMGGWVNDLICALLVMSVFYLAKSWRYHDRQPIIVN